MWRDNNVVVVVVEVGSIKETKWNLTYHEVVVGSINETKW
jgi:hypothetical protein